MKNIISDFEDIALKQPQKVALVDRSGAREMTYGQLDTLRLQVASKIVGTGISSGQPILICMGRKSEYVAAFLGILSAGCAAVPVSPEYPEERIDYIRTDCGAKLVITDGFFADIDKYSPVEDGMTEPEEMAYIVYTSGSTGRPKGVVHTVRSLQTMVARAAELFSLDESGIYASVTPFSFVGFVYDILLNLLLGAEIHILSDSARKDAAAIAEYYTKHRVNIGFLSPHILKNFHCSSPYIKRIITGSEQLNDFYTEQYQVVNVYASSEMGIVSAFPVDRMYRNTPIGKPLVGGSFTLLMGQKVQEFKKFKEFKEFKKFKKFKRENLL